MASNGLVANASKTIFIILNLTKNECEQQLTKEITIDKAMVTRSNSTKLLGLTIGDKMNWKEQINGANGLVNALNHRTFTIRRIKNQIPKKDVIKSVQSLWMSKLRYGLQFCGKVRTNSDDSSNIHVKSIQIAQNKMLRMMEGVSLKEHITSKSLLEKYNLPSVNQLNGEIKLLEAWKSINTNDYPFKMEANNTNPIMSDRILRPESIKIWKDSAKSKTGTNSFSIDTAKLWNNCPEVIKLATSIGIAKSEIKKHCKTFQL